MATAPGTTNEQHLPQLDADGHRYEIIRSHSSRLESSSVVAVAMLVMALLKPQEYSVFDSEAPTTSRNRIHCPDPSLCTAEKNTVPPASDCPVFSHRQGLAQSAKDVTSHVQTCSRHWKHDTNFSNLPTVLASTDSSGNCCSFVDRASVSRALQWCCSKGENNERKETEKDMPRNREPCQTQLKDFSASIFIDISALQVSMYNWEKIFSRQKDGGRSK